MSFAYRKPVNTPVKSPLSKTTALRSPTAIVGGFIVPRAASYFLASAQRALVLAHQVTAIPIAAPVESASSYPSAHMDLLLSALLAN
jgi:hypothetical protein